jgi:hypothetical protein
VRISAALVPEPLNVNDNDGPVNCQPLVLHRSHPARTRQKRSSLTRKLILTSPQAAPPAKTINRDAAGNISRYIGTSIPGVGKVSLDPLLGRQRLEKIGAGRSSRLDLIVVLRTPYPGDLDLRLCPHDILGQ